MPKARLAHIAIITLSLLATQPAAADVKAGVDAWSQGDFQSAVKQWRDPAMKGDADAQFNMAQAYKLGRGVRQDLNAAADWYQRAAKQGHLQAADSLGHLLHYQGKIAEALPYLETSTRRGEPRSQYLLATELFNGVHIGKDWVRAYALMTRASSAGLSPASRSLVEMDKFIPLEQRQQGIVMAGEIENSSAQVRAAQVAGFPIDTKPQAAVAKPVEVPASAKVTEPGFPGAIPPIDGKPVTKVAAKPAAPAKAAKVETAKPQPPANGNWRIQLGAFGSRANATRLWGDLKPRVNGLSALTPFYTDAGNITRLQVGPFGDRSEAEAMCNKVKTASPGQACFSVKP